MNQALERPTALARSIRLRQATALAVFMAGAAFVFNAQALPPSVGRVTFQATDHSPYRAAQHYRGNTIRYYIGDTLRNVAFVVNGVPYTVNMRWVIQEAMKEWQEATGINFKEVTVLDDATDLGLQMLDEFSPTPAEGTWTLASATKRIEHQRAIVTYWQSEIEKFLKDPGSDVKLYTDSMPTDQLLRLLLKIVSKHEIGHILGFDHPETAISDRAVQIIGSYENPQPPIMESNPVVFMSYLYSYLRGPIAARDVVLAEQEIRAFRMVNLPVRELPAMELLLSN
jgi:hypothetical protein